MCKRSSFATWVLSSLCLALAGCGSCSSSPAPQAEASAEPAQTAAAAPRADVPVDALCGHMFDLEEMDDPDPTVDKAELAEEKKEFTAECLSTFGDAKRSMPEVFAECADCLMRAKRPEQAERCEGSKACERVSSALDKAEQKRSKKKK